MSQFHYQENQLFVEGVSLAHIAARWGTPCYVYSRAMLTAHWSALEQAFAEYPHRICYAVKANSNLAVLNVLARLGSGFDIVSVGELERVLIAGGDPSKIVFSGVGKKRNEMERALEVGIFCFNVESKPELEQLQHVAQAQGKKAPVSLRINPDVDAGTHPYTATGKKENKFGIPINQALALYQFAANLPNIELIGVDCHIGSQLIDMAPFVQALDHILGLIDQLMEVGIHLRHIDMGGGLGVHYSHEHPPSIEVYSAEILARLKSRSVELILEPGRMIAANAGVLLTQVEYLKTGEAKKFAVVDAAMNDLLRPALYSAWQNILPVVQRQGVPHVYDVVGPVCETGDFLGLERNLNIIPGDLLVVEGAGAYGFTMSSNYNTRPRAAEVMVDGTQVYCVRARETLTQLWTGESLLPE